MHPKPIDNERAASASVTEASPELAERIRREAELYDDGALDRDHIDKALLYTTLGPSQDRRDRFMREVTARHEHNRVLEIGSQSWLGCFVNLGLRPTNLTCINISQRELDWERENAQRRGVDIEFRLMDAHQTDYPDNTFDLVYGKAILHHLEFERAVKEIARILKPGGEILFIEPLLLNPALRLIRWLTPKARTPDERPLAREELAILDRYFHVAHLYSELFEAPAAMLSQKLKLAVDNPLIKLAHAADNGLSETMPWFGAYYRTITVYGRKRG
jgi:SAM-dependent methyltransferase